MPASSKPYMGAVPYSGGVTFRVWAPFATGVNVAGTSTGGRPARPCFTARETGTGRQMWTAARRLAVQVCNRDALSAIRRSGKTIPMHVNDQLGGEQRDRLDRLRAGLRSYTMPPWNELVIYEVHVGTFQFDGGGRGTFNSLIAKLDYLVDLGVNAIEIMAAGEFPADQSWGYNQAYMFSIESSYGGPNGFRSLVNEAHRRGIAVLFDVVYNHIGPSDLDMWRFDGWSENEKGGIDLYNDWRSVTPWGEQNRPDYGRPQVRDYLRDNALRWLEQRYCDGLRWDAKNYLRNVYGNNNDPAHDVADGWSLMQWIHGRFGNISHGRSASRRTCSRTHGSRVNRMRRSGFQCTVGRRLRTSRAPGDHGAGGCVP